MEQWLSWARAHRQVLAYLVFGVLTTLLNLVLYALCSAVFGYTAANSWGNVLAYLICILFAYATNRAFVFASHTHGRAALRELGAFLACRLGTMLLDAVIMLVCGNLLARQGTALVLALLGRWLSAAQAQSLWGLGVKAGANLVVILANYLLSKRVVFRTPKR